MTTSTTTPDTDETTTHDDTPTVTVDIDPATLAAAQAAALAATADRIATPDKTPAGKKSSSPPPIRAIPALIVGTGSTTTATTLLAGAALPPAGIAAVAAGTLAAGIATMVTTHVKNAATKTAAGSKTAAGKGAARHGAAGRTGGTKSGGRAGKQTSRGPGAGPGGKKQGAKSGIRAGMSALTRRGAANAKTGTSGTGAASGRTGTGSKKTGGAAGAAGSTGTTTGKKSPGKSRHAAQTKKGDLLGPARGDIAKRAKDALTAPNSKTGGRKNKTGAGTTAGATTGKAGTRAALKKAKDRVSNSTPGRAVRAAGRGLKAVAKPVTAPLTKAVKKSLTASGAARAGRAAHKAVTRPLGRGIAKAVKKAGQSKAAATVRAASTRLAQQAKKNLLTRPWDKAKKALSGWRKTWKTAHRGKAAYTARLTKGAAQALFLGAVTAVPGILAGTLAALLRMNGAGRVFMWGKTVALRVFIRNIQRARRTLARVQKMNSITFDLTDSGTAADPGTSSGDTLTTLLGGTSMSPFLLATQNVADAYSRYSPMLMVNVGAEYAGLPGGIRSTGAALQHLSMNSAEKYPIHAALAQAMVGIYEGLMNAATLADGIYPNFRAKHEHDIMRLEQPRKGFSGEQMWNITPGQQTDGQGFNRPSVFAQSCMNIATAYAAFAPTSMIQVYREYSSLSQALDHIASTVDRLAKNSTDNYPVDASVVDQLAQVVGMIRATASEASKLMAMFRRLHAQDLNKTENPRKGAAGERMWDA